MRRFRRKIYLSILTTILVFLTTFATTYAWVGIFTYSSTGDVDLNLKTDTNSLDYYLTISSSGNNGTFGENVALKDIQLQIMENFGMNLEFDTTNSNAVDKFFKDKVSLIPTTAVTDNHGNITSFEELLISNNTGVATQVSNNYYKFDLYLSVDSKFGITTDTMIKSSVGMLNLDQVLVGTASTYNLISGNSLINNPNKPSDIGEKFPLLVNLPNTFTINSANSARVALEVYQPINIDNEYTTETPYKTYIYQGGTQEPSKNGDIYSLGGILPEEYNFAIQEENHVFNTELIIPEYVKNRTELELINKNKVIYSADDNKDNYLGVVDGIQTKMKVTVYFWFEGWDADCIRAIDNKNVSLNLTFTSDINADYSL